MKDAHYIEPTRNWLEQIVIGLNFCPFAATPFRQGRVRIQVSHATSTEALSTDLIAEGQLLLERSHREIETTLLVHPQVLTDFFDFNEYLWEVERLVGSEGWAGILQVASFHPGYQFAGDAPDAVSNYTNRSPYPMLHLIREERLEEALLHYDAPEEIPNRNIARLEAMGLAEVQQRMNQVKFKNQ